MAQMIVQQLTAFNIPFNKKNITENIIFIPGGIIKIKSYNTIKHQTDMEKFIKQINNMLTLYQKPIYVYLDGIDTIDNFNIFCNTFYQFVDMMNVAVCYSPEMIQVGEYYYGIKNAGALWTLISAFELYYPIFQNKAIIIQANIYNRAIVILTDDELTLLNKYNIIIVDTFDTYNTICYITQDTYNSKDMFNYIIKYIPLQGGQRTPCRLIDGITTICPMCNKIVYTDFNGIRKHNCL